MNIGVIFGSRSPEHDVSIASAFGLMAAIEKHTEHTVIPLYITRDGGWIFDNELKNIKNFKHIEKYTSTFLPHINKTDGKTFLLTPKKGLLGGTTKQQIDVLRNMCHGENGEDGIVDAFAKLTNLPIVSPGMLAESIGLNKDMMKRLFMSLDIPLTPYLVFHKDQIDKKQIEKTLQYPLFVKPVNLGSSIGVSKCENAKELEQAIEVAGYFDDMIMIENGVENLREFNCSVLEKNGEIVTSYVEEPTSDESFLTFEEKYTSDTGSTMKGSKGKVNVPADISDELTEKIQTLTKKIYAGFQIMGGAPRIDFLYNTKSKKLYVNEINMIPGTMQLPLRVNSGWTVKEFINTLLQTSLQYHTSRQKNIDYQSNIIDHTINFLDTLKI